MLIFAAIVPHSPLLLPAIGKEHAKKLRKTLEAFKTLEEDLYAAKPEAVVVISPHGSVLPDTFGLFISGSYVSNLKEFGDLSTTLNFKSAFSLIEEIRRLKLQEPPVPLTGITDKFLDYGTVVPLALLTAHLPEVPIVPLGVSSLPLAEHQKVGAQIGEILQQSRTRVAVLASADLAHTLTDDAPGGFAKEGKQFDELVVQHLRKDEREKILELENLAEKAKACGLRPLAMMLGILEHLNCTLEPLAYEGPFGVGYLVARFNFR